MLGTSCAGVKHCGNIHTCDKCASERQARIADHANTLERQHGQLTLTVLSPNHNTQAEISRLRASFIRRALAPAGIWTIETGEQFGGLHLNILSPAPAPAKWREAQHYSELVRTTARDAAAYIAKRAGMPPLDQYTGRLHGNFGQLFEYLTNNRAYPPVQAAALESTMSGASSKKPESKPKDKIDCPGNYPDDWVQDESKFDPTRARASFMWSPEDSNPPWVPRKKTLEARREIMRRNLPNLYAAISKPAIAKPSTSQQPAITDEWEEGRE